MSLDQIGQVVKILDGIMEHLALPPLKENKDVTVHVSKEPPLLTLNFRKEDSVPIDMEIGEEKFRMFFDEFEYKWIEDTEHIINDTGFFEEVILGYFLNKIVISSQDNQSTLSVIHKDGTVIDTIWKESPSAVREYKPFCDYSEEKIDDIYFQRGKKYFTPAYSEEQLQKMKEEKRVIFRRGEHIEYYFFVYMCFAIPFIFAALDYSSGSMQLDFLLKFSIVWSAVGIILYFYKRHRLKLKEYPISCTEKQFDEALKKTCDEMNWVIIEYTPHYVRTKRIRKFWDTSWGEKVYIFRDTNRLYIKSICDPEMKSSLFSFGWNKRNTQAFLKHLKETGAY